MRIATSFSPVKPKYTASGRNRAGHTTSFNTVATPVGAKSFNAFLPSNPAPRPIRARGVASTAILLIVLEMITG